MPARTRRTPKPADLTVNPAGLIVETEDYRWSAYIADHPMRKESSTFRVAKRTAKAILATLDKADYPYGPGPWEMHHGGSLWVIADKRWRLYRSRVPVEWSMQFCADPARVDLVRRDALDLIRAFPDTLPALHDLGYQQAEAILTTPIADAAGVAVWTDCLFNACVPLQPGDHTGVLPAAAGEHHYPFPVKAADFIKFADFVLWVTLPDGTHGAVAPLAPRGSGDARVRLIYARHGTTAGDAVATAQRTGRAVILPGDSTLARQAFLHQPG